MPYYNNFQQYYPQNNSQTNNLIWVQGENSAKSYPVSAGQSMLLMDSESSTMYIKSTDQSGMPLPLRIFDYTERTQNRSETPQAVAEQKMDYVSRDELDALRDELRAEIRQINKPVSTTRTTAKEK